jgi:translation initiation factor IF-2
VWLALKVCRQRKIIIVVKDEQTGREMAENRQRLARESSYSSYQAGPINYVSIAVSASEGNVLVVKTDVQESAEALTRALRELRFENVEAVVTFEVLVVCGTGEVSMCDVANASVTEDNTVIAFNVAASFSASDDARAALVPIEYYHIIYGAIESVELRIQKVLTPTPNGE